MPDFVTADEGRLLEQAARNEGGGGDDGGRVGSGSGGGGGGEGGGRGRGEWKALHKRRLQINGGIPHPLGMVEEELPLFLREGGTEETKRYCPTFAARRVWRGLKTVECVSNSMRCTYHVVLFCVFVFSHEISVDVKL